MKKNFIKIVLDLLLGITFVLLMNPRVFNGLPFHEIGSLIIGVAFLVHIGLNYKWVINTTKKIFDPKFSKKTRFCYLLNILLLISMATLIISGIFISKVVFPDLAVQGRRSMRGIHNFSADASLFLVGLHIALHWKWIMSICKKAFKSEDGQLRKGRIAAVALSLVVLAGGIQWYSTAAPSNMGDFRQRHFMQNGERQPFGDGKNWSQSDRNQAPPTGEYRRGPYGDTERQPWNGDYQRQPRNEEFQGRTSDGEIAEGFLGGGDFHGRKGHGGSRNPFLVILKYFAIWAAIIIPVYYLEKFSPKKKPVAEDGAHNLN